MLRLGFLLVLWLFLFAVARSAWRELRTDGPEAGPGVEITIIDPARSHWQAGQKARIRAGATVGRAEGNTLVIDEDTVSAQHAVFHRERGRWWLEDLGSTNGTFINRHPLVGRGVISEGDEVMFGRVAIAFGARRRATSKVS